MRSMTRIVALVVFVAGLAAAAAISAEVVNFDSGFETPAVDPGSGAVDANTFDHWSVAKPPGHDAKLLVNLRRDAAAYWGARYLEVQLVGVDGENNGAMLVQSIDKVPDHQSLYLRMQLKKVGAAPSEGEIEITIGNGVDVATPHVETVQYSQLDDTDWSEFVFWPISIPDGSGVDTQVTISIRFYTNWVAHDFAIAIDDVTLESLTAPNGSFTEYLSFEPKDPAHPPEDGDPVGVEFDYDSGANPHEWDIHPAGAPDPDKLRLKADGGSDGLYYLRALSYGVSFPPYFGYLIDLHSDADHYLLDAESRFAISADLRAAGTAPLFGEKFIQMGIYRESQCGNPNFSLMTRKRVRLADLTNHFQTFGFGIERFDGRRTPLWFRAREPFCFRLRTSLTNSDTSHIDIDNIQLDRIAPVEMYPSGDVILLDAAEDAESQRGRPVPTTFYTDSAHSSQTGGVNVRLHIASEYWFYLPEGIKMIASEDGYTGSDLDTWTQVNNGSGVYDVEETHQTHVFDGESYHLWILRPVKLKYNKEDLQFYLDSRMPAGTTAYIYYETRWLKSPPGDPHPYWDGDESTTPDWNTGFSPRVRRVKVQTRAFPRLTRPEHLVTSIGWIRVGDQRAWPDFMESYGTFGFSHVGGHRGLNYYAKDPEVGVSQTELDFYEDARAAGYGNFGIDSPFSYRNLKFAASIDPTDPEAKTIHTNSSVAIPCPAYGLDLIDEGDYCPPGDLTPAGECGADDGKHYHDEVEQLGKWIARTGPSHLMLDSESFQEGADIALKHDDLNPDKGCKRCNDYLDAYRANPGHPRPLATMADALKQMGADRAVAIMQAVLAAGGTVPQLGFYHTAGDGDVDGGYRGGPGSQTYTGVFNNKVVDTALKAAGSSLESPALGHWPLYNERPPITRDNFVALQANVVANDLEYFPILIPSSRDPSKKASWVYDRVLETLGSGAIGIEFFAFEHFEGADLFYFAKAMEAILPVEHVLVDAIAIENVTAEIPIGATSPALLDLYTVRSSVVRRGNEYVILISSYGAKGGGDAPVMDEDPPWIGRVKVSIPTGQAIAGVPMRLADGEPGTATNQGDVVVLELDFEPGADGAHTALYYLCDTSGGSSDCEDGDGDGILDQYDNCVEVPNRSQIATNASGSGKGDACYDTDSDGFMDDVDNCVQVSNRRQEDADGDGVGDRCDNCAETRNSTQSDSDGDGLGTACDPKPTIACESFPVHEAQKEDTANPAQPDPNWIEPRAADTARGSSVARVRTETIHWTYTATDVAGFRVYGSPTPGPAGKRLIENLVAAEAGPNQLGQYFVSIEIPRMKTTYVTVTAYNDQNIESVISGEQAFAPLPIADRKSVGSANLQTVFASGLLGNERAAPRRSCGARWNRGSGEPGPWGPGCGAARRRCRAHTDGDDSKRPTTAGNRMLMNLEADPPR